ncbi:MAG: diguanylate cyclase, partial [Planctomycetaceae bacterium]|nr:diguanylate cyclase [Planctomycetaceae bacterium]
MLKHFAPNPARGFAALLFVDGHRLQIEQSHGLSKVSRNDLDLDLDQLAQLVPGEARILQDRELRQSEIWSKLHYLDRRKAQEVILLPISKAEEVFGVLITTSLSEGAGTRQEQLELALRLMGSLSGNFRQQIQLKQREHEIRQTEELLQLRSLTDATYEGPLEMVEAFLQAMLSMVDADSITLFLPHSSELGQWKPMASCRGDLPSSCLPHWEKHESQLLNHYEWGRDLTSYYRDDLEKLGIETLLRSALMVPLPQEGRIAGVFCISRCGERGFNHPQRELAKWSAQHLGKTLTKLQSIADIKLQAKQDGLTELANRRTFDEQLEREIRVAQRASVECSLLLCDLDRFKSINDTY